HRASRWVVLHSKDMTVELPSSILANGPASFSTGFSIAARRGRRGWLTIRVYMSPEVHDVVAGTSGAEQPLRLAELVASFSLASAVGTGWRMEGAFRSCVIGIRLGEAVGLDDPALRDLYYVSLLALIGCTADSYRFAELVGDEVAITAGDGQTVDWGNN